MGVFLLHTSAALEVQNRVQFTWAKWNVLVWSCAPPIGERMGEMSTGVLYWIC